MRGTPQSTHLHKPGKSRARPVMLCDSPQSGIEPTLKRDGPVLVAISKQARHRKPNCVPKVGHQTHAEKQQSAPAPQPVSNQEKTCPRKHSGDHATTPHIKRQGAASPTLSMTAKSSSCDTNIANLNTINTCHRCSHTSSKTNLSSKPHMHVPHEQRLMPRQASGGPTSQRKRCQWGLWPSRLPLGCNKL